MKSDSELRRDVLDELEWEPSLDARSIAVAVKDGVVTLSGTVSSYYQKWEAEKAAKRVAGVKAVANDIEVRLPSTSERTDADIAHAVVTALSSNVLVPADRIKATVENGWVTLEGQVDWNFEREAAEDAVRYLSGVKGVTNLITIKERPKPTDVKTKIESELKRVVEQDAKNIRVETTDGRVILDGKVHSWFEREQAEHAAWSAPGVREVENNITIQP